MAMPEEVNRILTDRVSRILFCPTQTALENLEREGYSQLDCMLVRTGDVMKDCVEFYKPLARKPEAIVPEKFALLTLHRAENTDNKEQLASLIRFVNEQASKLPVVFPIHPRTRKAMGEHGLEFSNSVVVIEPVSYLEMLWLLSNCELVMTDSGGLQKEAYFFERFCVTLRNETEWTELVEAGVNCLITDPEVDNKIEAVISRSLSPDFSQNMYGKGNASDTIAETLLEFGQCK